MDLTLACPTPTWDKAGTRMGQSAMTNNDF